MIDNVTGASVPVPVGQLDMLPTSRWSAAEDGGSYNDGLLQADLAALPSELLGQSSVNEPRSGVVGKAGIPGTVSSFAKCFRRLCIKNIVAANCDYRAFKQMLPGGEAIVAGLFRGCFCCFAVLAARHRFCVL